MLGDLCVWGITRNLYFKLKISAEQKTEDAETGVANSVGGGGGQVIQINLPIKSNHQRIGMVSRVRRRISQSTVRMKENSKKKILRPSTKEAITPAEEEAEARVAVIISVTSVKTKILSQVPSKETTMKKLV